MDVRSSITSRTYRLVVSSPEATAPLTGWPVVYVLDGDLYTEGTIDVHSSLRRVWAPISEAVIVGIGYPDADAEQVAMLRMWDFLPVQPGTTDRRRFALQGASERMKPELFGGGDAFIRALEKELIPAIDRQLRIDAAHRVLIGHSFAGLAALNVALTRPKLFETVVAVSPTLYFGDRELFRRLPGNGSADDLPARLLITVGGLEDPEGAERDALTAAQRELIDTARYVRNAREFVAELKGRGAQAVSFRVLPGDNHLTALWATLPSALLLALPQPGRP
jgi:uncharacterized protein